MAIECPKCKARIPSGVIRREFDCPSCRTQLAGKFLGAMVAFMAVWAVADLIVRVALESALPTQDTLALFLRIVVSGLIGWGLFVTVYASLCNVTLKDSVK
jgi:hypothetical protein